MLSELKEMLLTQDTITTCCVSTIAFLWLGKCQVQDAKKWLTTMLKALPIAALWKFVLFPLLF